jgi:hypothetical protein
VKLLRAYNSATASKNSDMLAACEFALSSAAFDFAERNAAHGWAVEQSLALLWITLLTRAFLLFQIKRSAGAADLESTLQKLLHCWSGSRFPSYIPIAVRRMGVSAAAM